MKKPTYIALVGPPASGKSSVFKLLKKMKRIPDYKITYLPEVATHLVDKFGEYFTNADPLTRQTMILKYQRDLEECANRSHSDLIITDRCALDTFIYLDEEDVKKVISNEEKIALRNQYNYLIFLNPVSLELSKSDDTYRFEDSSSRVAVINKTVEFYRHFDNVYYINESPDIYTKAINVCETINRIMGNDIYLL